ncbi:MAG: SpoIIIAC/SpoIIIAD family protein [Limnochordia bacterium]
MPDIARIVGLGIIITVLLAHLRKRYPELAPELSLAFVVGVFLILLGPLDRVLQVFYELGQRADLSGFYLGVDIAQHWHCLLDGPRGPGQQRRRRGSGGLGH